MECRRQLDELPSYRAAIAVSVASSSNFADNMSLQHLINIADLHLFLAFWWEPGHSAGSSTRQQLQTLLKQF
jgi:hypothetical protein